MYSVAVRALLSCCGRTSSSDARPFRVDLCVFRLVGGVSVDAYGSVASRPFTAQLASRDTRKQAQGLGLGKNKRATVQFPTFAYRRSFSQPASVALLEHSSLERRPQDPGSVGPGPTQSRQASMADSSSGDGADQRSREELNQRLHDAADAGDVEKLRQAIAAGADPNALRQRAISMTALCSVVRATRVKHNRAVKGRTACVRALLDAGASASAAVVFFYSVTVQTLRNRRNSSDIRRCTMRYVQDLTQSVDCYWTPVRL